MGVVSEIDVNPHPLPFHDKNLKHTQRDPMREQRATARISWFPVPIGPDNQIDVTIQGGKHSELGIRNENGKVDDLKELLTLKKH